MRRLTFSLAAAAALTLTSGLAHAQTREGFYFGGGAGWGSAKATCADCNEWSLQRNSSAPPPTWFPHSAWRHGTSPG